MKKKNLEELYSNIREKIFDLQQEIQQLNFFIIKLLEDQEYAIEVDNENREKELEIEVKIAKNNLEFKEARLYVLEQELKHSNKYVNRNTCVNKAYNTTKISCVVQPNNVEYCGTIIGSKTNVFESRIIDSNC